MMCEGQIAIEEENLPKPRPGPPSCFPALTTFNLALIKPLGSGENPNHRNILLQKLSLAKHF
jgi:hypothetical protein